MNKKGDEGTGLWVKISIAILLIVIMFIAVPKMLGNGFSSIDSQFCLAVDTDNDGVSDQIEKMEKRCICDDDIPSKQFYVIDDRDVVVKNQKLFVAEKKEDLPNKISYEDVTRISKYIYEMEACVPQTAKGTSVCANQPKLLLKDSSIKLTTDLTLDKFCFVKTGACSIEDFKEDFFVKESTYTYKTECATPNEGDACKKLRETRCAEEKAKAENEKQQEEQV